jgi:hypothetical protein
MILIPQGHIRDYYIDTELPIFRSLGRRRLFRPMSKAQIVQRKLPLMSIKVEPTADSSDFSSGVTFWTSTKFLRDPTELTRLIADDENLRYIGYETERIVMHFGISFTMETDLKASELLMYLKRTMPIGYKFYLNDINIATEIPRDILRAIWSDMKLGDNSTGKDMEDFAKYLGRVSAGNIESVINSASSRQTFAYNAKSNLLVTLASPPTMSVNRDENVVKSAQVDIQFDVDLSVPISYAYRQEESLGDPLSATPFDLNIENDKPYFSSAVRIRPPENINNGLQLVFFTSLVTGDINANDPNAVDKTDMSTSISTRIRYYINQLFTQGIEDSVVAKLWLDGNDVDDQSWEFDTTSWELDIKMPALQARQKYFFGIYADVSMLDKLAPIARREQPTSPMIK